jgi:hypothetical protein
LISTSDVCSFDDFVQDLLSHEMTIHFNVFSFFHKKLDLSQNSVVGLLAELCPNSLSNNLNQMISIVAAAIALYSASALDLATTACFLLFQVTAFPPTNMQKPVVDFLSSGLLTRSASV